MKARQKGGSEGGRSECGCVCVMKEGEVSVDVCVMRKAGLSDEGGRDE